MHAAITTRSILQTSAEPSLSRRALLTARALTRRRRRALASGAAFAQSVQALPVVQPDRNGRSEPNGSPGAPRRSSSPICRSSTRIIICGCA